jgi:hypothetical protein
MTLRIAISSWRTALAVLSVTCGLAVAPHAASGAVFPVVSTVDTGGTCTVSCTLRQAINSANATVGPDSIDFPNAAIDVVINDPLPPVLHGVTIDGSGAAGSVSSVRGSTSYVTAHCGTATAWALDIADDLDDPADNNVSPSTSRFLAFYNVCGRAIKSGLGAPTINVGPRRADGTLSLTGAAAGSVIEFYKADNAPNSGEADDTLIASALTNGAGSYSFTPSPELAPDSKIVAQTTSASSSSTFSGRVSVPSDIVSPSLISAVAVSNIAVRLDFNEGISPGSVTPGQFNLTIAGTPRPVTGITVYGNSVYLATTVAWATGEAGGVGLTGAGRVTDFSGNEVIGTPATTVFAGPGELTGPTISSFRFSPSRFCKRVTRNCKRGVGYAYLTLNKPCRVIFTVRRGSRRARSLVSFVRRLKQGRNKVKMTAVVSGRTLPASVLTLRAVAEDVARSRTAPTDAAFRIVTNKSLL